MKGSLLPYLLRGRGERQSLGSGLPAPKLARGFLHDMPSVSGLAFS